MTRLEDWSVYSGALVGRVYDHPRFPDGTNIITPFNLIDLNNLKAETPTRTYALGEPQKNDQTICARPDLPYCGVKG